MFQKKQDSILRLFVQGRVFHQARLAIGILASASGSRGRGQNYMCDMVWKLRVFSHALWID